MVSERIKAIREKLNRREKKVRADRQAKSRRIEKGDPDGAGEAAQVKVKNAKDEAEMSASEARELASDAKTLVATELGISRSEAEDTIEDSASMFEKFSDQLGTLDGDGDGDTDLLTALDTAVEDSGGNGGGGSGGNGDGDDEMSLDEAVGTEPLFDPTAGGPGGDLSDADIDFSDDRT